MNNKEYALAAIEANRAGKILSVVDGNFVINEPDVYIFSDEEIRITRDLLLEKCDWTQMPDTSLPLETKTAWQLYRQALRDIPQQADFPENVVWPEVPEG